MSTISSLRSISEVLSYFENEGPLAASDFSFKIDAPEVVDTQLVVTGFNIPLLGIQFSPSSEYLTFNQPSINVSDLTLSFIEKPSKLPLRENESPIFTLYQRQYNPNGTLRFIPENAQPKILIGFDTGGEEGYKVLVQFEGCKFSLPTPVVNLSSTDKSVFTTRISYSNYKVL